MPPAIYAPAQHAGPGATQIANGNTGQIGPEVRPPGTPPPEPPPYTGPTPGSAEWYAAHGGVGSVGHSPPPVAPTPAPAPVPAGVPDFGGNQVLADQYARILALTHQGQ